MIWGKKILVFLLFIVICCSGLLARNIIIDGYGDTPEDAKNDAKINLTSYIFGDGVKSSLNIGTSDSGDGSVKESFNELISISIEGELLGVEYSNPSLTSSSESIRGKYKVSAVIADSNSSMYVVEMKNLAKSIDAIYAQEASSNTKKIRLQNLLTNIKKYDDYMQVVARLGVDIDDIPVYDAPITYQSVSHEIQGILFEEESNLIREIENQDKADTLMLSELYAKLEATRLEQIAFENQQQEADKIAEQSSLLRVREQLAAFLAEESSLSKSMILENTLDSAVELAERVSLAQREWLELYSDYNSLIQQESSRLLKELNSQKKSLEAMPYKITEMSGNKPTEQAVANRNNEIKELVEKKRSELNKYETLIKQSMLPSLKARYDALLMAVKDLNERTFVISLEDGPLKFRNKGYDAIKSAWDIAAGLLINDRVLTIGNWSVTYAELGGMVTNDISVTNMYDNEIEVYDALLGNKMGEYFDLEAEVKIKYDIDKSEFVISIQSLNLTKKGISVKSFISAPIEMGALSNNLTPAVKPEWIDTGITIEDDNEEQVNSLKKIKFGGFDFGVDVGVGLDANIADEVTSYSADLKVPFLLAVGFEGTNNTLGFGVVPTVICGFSSDGISSIVGGILGELLYYYESKYLKGTVGVDFGFSEAGLNAEFMLGVRQNKLDYYFSVKFDASKIGVSASARYMF